jgi:hypothetical protein
LEVLALHEETARLLLFATDRKFAVDLLAARLHHPHDAPRGRLPFVAKANAARFVGVALLEELDQLLTSKSLIPRHAHRTFMPVAPPLLPWQF